MIEQGASPSLDRPCPRCGASAGFRCFDLREKHGKIRITGRVHVERDGKSLGRTCPWKSADPAEVRFVERFARALGVTFDEAQQRLAAARKKPGP